MKSSNKQTAAIWFLVGSQHLYGPETLAQVEKNAREMVAYLDGEAGLPLPIALHPVLTTEEAITAKLQEAGADPACAGVIVWMHTFSPSRMWIRGLSPFRKPTLHLHTQYGSALPWESIDMDFMNLHQSAHGDREFGFLSSRLRREHKVVAGHWQSPAVGAEVDGWMRAAMAWNDWQGARFARFGDNMRHVAVTEGDKVAAQIQFGFSVEGYGVGDLVAVAHQIEDKAVAALAKEYLDGYSVAAADAKKEPFKAAVADAARIELALREFLKAGNFKGFTTTFEDLHGLNQLPGLPVQRLMADGYGFGAEGDWKVCALVRALKVMAADRKGGVSFMEDYTYDFAGAKPAVLGAHMLEICPSIANARPSLEVHPLGIGGKADPARLVFSTAAGPAVNASLLDIGNRFRFVVNVVDGIEVSEPMPKLPVARALWHPQPDFSTAAKLWILAGGSHHTAFAPALDVSHIEDFARLFEVECFVIDRASTERSARNELRWNDAAYAIRPSGLTR